MNGILMKKLLANALLILCLPWVVFWTLVGHVGGLDGSGERRRISRGINLDGSPESYEDWEEGWNRYKNKL